MANTEIKAKDVFVSINFFVAFVSQAHETAFDGLIFLNHAKPNINIVIPIKYGLNGSSQEKEAAILLVPASSASTGVMQHMDAVIDENSPMPIIFLSLNIFGERYYSP